MQTISKGDVVRRIDGFGEHNEYRVLNVKGYKLDFDESQYYFYLWNTGLDYGSGFTGTMSEFFERFEKVNKISDFKVNISVAVQETMEQDFSGIYEQNLKELREEFDNIGETGKQNLATNEEKEQAISVCDDILIRGNIDRLLESRQFDELQQYLESVGK